MNWNQVITKLQSQGLTQPQIADQVGCAQSTISDLLNGVTKQPNYALGASLVALLDLQAKQATHQRAEQKGV